MLTMNSQDTSDHDDVFPDLHVRCTRLKSIPEVSDQESVSAHSSPRPERPYAASVRSKSLPGSVTLGLPPRPTSRGTKSSTEHGDHGKPPVADREVKILVLGYTGVGKTAIVVRYVTKRFIGDYASYETVCSTAASVDNKPIKVSILDMTWEAHTLDDIERYLDWCHGVMILFSLVDGISLHEVETVCRKLMNKLKRTPSVLVGTKSDLTHARQVTLPEIQQLISELKCPYVETSARESLASSVQAFTTLLQEIGSKKKKSKKNSNKNGYSSKFHNIRERLRSIAGEFRQRTNTF